MARGSPKCSRSSSPKLPTASWHSGCFSSPRSASRELRLEPQNKKTMYRLLQTLCPGLMPLLCASRSAEPCAYGAARICHSPSGVIRCCLDRESGWLLCNSRRHLELTAVQDVAASSAAMHFRSSPCGWQCWPDQLPTPDVEPNHCQILLLSPQPWAKLYCKSPDNYQYSGPVFFCTATASNTSNVPQNVIEHWILFSLYPIGNDSQCCEALSIIPSTRPCKPHAKPVTTSLRSSRTIHERYGWGHLHTGIRT